MPAYPFVNHNPHDNGFRGRSLLFPFRFESDTIGVHSNQVRTVKESMAISDILILLGGTALFLFGMSLMGDGLKKVVGNKLELVLYRLSSTPLRGILLGAAVTGVIQSSSATSIMVVGFVNSGMMKLRQAIGVIMGAIIGTSVTGWVIFLSTLSGESSGWIGLLSTEAIGAAFAVAGILLHMISKKMAGRELGSILLGFAVLMFGMKTMSGSVSGLKDSPAFLSMISAISRPLPAFLIGVAATAVLQSASASVGILQALSVTGAIRFSGALPMLMGVAVGAAVPVLLSAIGADTNGKRTAYSYLFINAGGVLLFSILFLAANAVFRFPFMENVITTFGIALTNTVFRIIMILLLIPFMSLIEKAVTACIPDREDSVRSEEDFEKLDERFLSYPPLAVEQCRLVVGSMAEKVQESVRCAVGLLTRYSEKKFKKVTELESATDRYEDRLGHFLIRITNLNINEEQSDTVGEYLHVVTDFERIGDHALNIAQSARELNEKKITFSEAGTEEVSVLSGAVLEILSVALKAFSESDPSLGYRVEPLEELIDDLCGEMKARHVDRLTRGQCTFQQGYIFNDLLSNFERISDHCSNIGLAVLERNAPDFNPHEYTASIKEMRRHGFKESYEAYSERFRLPGAGPVSPKTPGKDDSPASEKETASC